MDDGDGALPVEFAATDPNQGVLTTLYNGTLVCADCGAWIVPSVAMFTGNRCPDCTTRASAHNVRNMMGR